MTLPHTGAPRDGIKRPRAKRKKKPPGASHAKTVPSDVVGLIDDNFDRKVRVMENGKPKRVTVFAAVFRQLWTAEMGGDRQALSIRRSYEQFARRRRAGYKREIVVISNLPDRGSRGMESPDV